MKKKFRVKDLPLPVLPDDDIFFAEDEKTVKTGVVESVGLNEEGQLLIICEGAEYQVGTRDRVFFTREDAQRYLENPSAFTEDYGILQDYGSLKLPVYPGNEYFFCDFNALDGRWEIFPDYYTCVFFDGDGSVRVRNGDCESTVIGKSTDPCFDTLRKAKAYIRSQGW